MDYEKKYKESLEKAKALICGETEMNAPVYYVDNIKDIFPELKESEDERIRKEIIKAVNLYCSEYLRGTKVRDEMLAWLEKQKPVDVLSDEERNKELSLSLQIQAYLNTACDELYAEGKPLYSKERLKDIHECMKMWQKLHNHYFYNVSELKPVEWSEEDETKLVNIIIMLKEGASHHFTKDDITKGVSWLKSIVQKYKGE